MTDLRPSTIPSAVDAPFDHAKFVEGIDGTRLYVRSNDQDNVGLRVFFCDGIGCDGFIWKHAFEPIASQFPVAHAHYRGHGRSAPPSDPENVRIEQLADDLAKVRESFGSPPAILFGHSMGVQVVLEHLRRHPKGVRALVLVCGSYGKVTHTIRGLPLVEYILPSLMNFAEKYPDVLRAVFTRIPHEMALRMAFKLGDLDPSNARVEDILPYMQHMTAIDMPLFLRMLKAAGEHTAEDLLERIDIPVLVVAGEKDTFTPAWLSTSMASRIPKADFLMIPGGSHAAAVEQSQLFNETVLKFFKERIKV